MDVHRPTLIDLVAGTEGPPADGDQQGGIGFAYSQDGIMTETQILWHGHREGDKVGLVFADGMHQGVRRNGRAKEDALPSMVLEEVADHPASHLMQFTAHAAGHYLLLLGWLAENDGVEEGENHLGGGGAVVLLVHGNLVLVPKLSDLEHGHADDVLVNLLDGNTGSLCITDDFGRLRSVAAQQRTQVGLPDRHMPTLQKLFGHLDVVHRILGDDNGPLQVAFCQIDLLILVKLIGTG